MVDKKSKYKKGAATFSGRESRFLSPKQEKMVAEQVWKLAEPLCQAEGIELVYVEYRKEPRGRTLRIYIDKPDGVMIDDCVNISRQMGDILDVTLNDSGAYHLEVSSPGPERPLYKASDFERFRGNMVNIRLSQPIDGKDKLRGILNRNNFV